MAFLCSSGQCCLVVKASAKSGSAGQSQSVKTVLHQPNHGAQTLNPVKKNSTLTTLPKAPPLVETTTTTALSPDLLETVKNVEVISRSEKNAVVPRVSVAGNYTVKGLFRQLVRQLASLPLAIAELFAIAGLSAIGTIIPQGESPEYYFQNYSDGKPVLGFLTWQWVLGLSFDHIYTAPYFLGLLLLLAFSLVACTSSRQLPMVKVARRWSFLKSEKAILQMDVTDTLPHARVEDIGTLLSAQGYEVFARGPSLYAFKGLAGRLAPIGVHAALLLIMAGGTLSAIGGYHGTVMVPQGLDFQLSDALRPMGILSMPSDVLNNNVHVDKFYIDYRPTGEVGQFHSDLSIVNLDNQTVFSNSISVNSPLKYKGVTIYQSDWAISAVQVRVDGSEPYNLVMAPLQKGDNKLYGTFLPLGEDGVTKAKGISILARDLQSVVLYDQEGQFVGVRRPGSRKPIQVNNVSIVVDDIIGSTGLELKMDPGVAPVYAGFGGLMLTTVISYLSHSQVWALQEGTSLVVGGKSNRARFEFEKELNEILDCVPEIRTKKQRGDFSSTETATQKQ